MNVTLHGRALWLGWLAFTVCAALSLWIVGTDILRILAGDGVLVGELTVASLPAALAGSPITPAAYLGLIGTTYLLEKLAFFGAAAVLAWRRPGELIALVVAIYLVTAQAAVFPPDIFALLPSDPLRAWLELGVVLTWLVLFAWLFFLFPDGRFTPRWTLLIGLAWLAEELFSIWQYAALGVDSQLGDTIATVVVVVSAAGAQGYRYWRVSSEIQRQQTKLFLGGLGIAFIGFSVGDAFVRANGLMTEAGPPERVVMPWLVQTLIVSLTSLCAPVALVVALLRYRLFDIDLVLHRAIVYGGLTAVVVGVYVIVVGGLSTLLSTDNVLISLVATGCIAILFQPFRQQLQRGATRLVYGERDEPYAVISRLGQRLEVTLAPGEILPAIVETVAGALRLPYAAIRIDGTGGLMIEATVGHPPTDPLRMPLSYQGQAIGELLLAPRTAGEGFSSADRRLLSDLARQAGVAAHAARLAEEARRLAADLQASRERLVLAREEERRRLRRDLHDGLGPRLAGLTLQLETTHDLLAHDPQADTLLADLTARMADAVADVRRVVYALRPPSLDELGLCGALRQAGESYGPGPPRVSVDVEDQLPGLPAAVEVATYRIATEALTNVIRHASARNCWMRVSVDCDRHELSLVVDDDGRGIPTGAQSGVGLQSMRERAEELRGVCIVSLRPEGGTRVQAILPLRSADD